MIVGQVVVSYPPGPCPFLANWTRCSGVKSVKRRFGSGGRSIWPGLGRLFVRGAGSVWEASGNAAALFGSKLGARDVLEPTPMLDLWNECVRQADRPNHNPLPAMSSATIARDRCFALIVFCFLIQASEQLSLWHSVKISGSWRSIWNEGGEFWCEAPASRNEPAPN